MALETRRYPQPVQEKLSERLDAAFKFSISEAEESGISIKIAKAKNKYGHWLMSQDQRRYSEAVPLFQEVAEFQELQTDRTEAAHTYHMLSSCQFLIGEIDTLQEANKSIKKAIEFYPETEEFIEKKKTAICMQFSIFNMLAIQTNDNNYINQGQKAYKKYARLLINDNDKGIKDMLADIGFTEKV